MLPRVSLWYKTAIKHCEAETNRLNKVTEDCQTMQREVSQRQVRSGAPWSGANSAMWHMLHNIIDCNLRDRDAVEARLEIYEWKHDAWLRCKPLT